MNIIIRELVDALPALRHINQQRMGARFSYKIARNLRIVESEMQYYEKIRGQLIDRYAEKGKDGKPLMENGIYKFGDNKEEFEREIGELLDTEFDMDFQPIRIDEIQKEGLKLMPAEMSLIWFMLEE